MGKIIEKIIDQFDLGMTQDPRISNERFSQLIKNFEAHTFIRKLVPLHEQDNGDSSAATNKIQNFTIAGYVGVPPTDYRLFGLGVSGTKARVFVNASFISSTWTSHATASAMTAVDFELFIYYPKTRRLYGASDGSLIWSCDPVSGGSGFDETDGNDEFAHTLATSYRNPRSSSSGNRPNISGLVHSKDDIMYIGYDNIIVSNDGSGDWTDPALTLPVDMVITSLSEYGNYLAIGVKSANEIGGSLVLLWDRNSTANDISEKIDWGEGNLQILEEIDGVLIGVSIAGTTITQVLSKITFRYYAGGKPVVFKQFISEANYTSNNLPRYKRKVNNYLYFPMKIKLNDSTQEGIWKVGRHVGSGQFMVSIERAPNNDTDLTSGEIHGFIKNGDIMFIAYTDNGVLAMTATDISGDDSASSIYESLIFGDQRKKFKLIAAGVMTEAMPSNGQIILGYKKDEETSYTTIFTNGTDSDIYHEAVNIESSGDTLPEFREISFQIKSTGGAVLTGLYFKAEEISNNPSS